MEPIQIRITQELKKRLEKEVETGIYPNRSEAVRAAIRNLTRGGKGE